MDYTFTFTEKEINYILYCLATRPYSECAETIANINEQSKQEEEKKK